MDSHLPDPCCSPAPAPTSPASPPPVLPDPMVVDRVAQRLAALEAATAAVRAALERHYGHVGDRPLGRIATIISQAWQHLLTAGE